MIAREFPYFWITWLTDFLAGEANCKYKIWFKGHYQKYDKLERNNNIAEWEIAHTALLNDIIPEYRLTSEKVLVEDETKFTVSGDYADISGKMDFVALNHCLEDGELVNEIGDAKTGKTKTSHVVQVKIYLWAATKKIFRNAGELPFVGKLFYPGDEEGDEPKVQIVSPPDKAFIQSMGKLIVEMANAKAPTATPSRFECGFCDIKACEFRFRPEQSPVQDGKATEF